MRLLLRPQVIRQAALAALLTAVACYPRIILWERRPDRVSFVLLVLLWVTFVLWSFTLAWLPAHAGCPVFAARPKPVLWGGAIGTGVVCALLLAVFVDPHLRRLTPEDYPDSISLWVAMALFSMAFDQLFLCFAPFAFFVRLFGNQTVALALTVVFGLFVMAVKVNSSPLPPPVAVIVGLILTRVVFGAFSVYLLVEGGVILVWAWAAVLQVRHLVPLLAGPS